MAGKPEGGILALTFMRWIAERAGGFSQQGRNLHFVRVQCHCG